MDHGSSPAPTSPLTMAAERLHCGPEGGVDQQRPLHPGSGLSSLGLLLCCLSGPLLVSLSHVLLPDVGGAGVAGWESQRAEGTRLLITPVNRCRRDSSTVCVPKMQLR